MPTLWAKRVTYESVQVGDDLPILVKHVSQESLDLYARQASKGSQPDCHGPHAAAEGATAESISDGMVDAEVVTMAYVAELLEKAFPVRSLMDYGSRLEMQATGPVSAGDTITFTGEVTDRREEEGHRLVECEVTCTNQLNRTVARAKATIPL